MTGTADPAAAAHPAPVAADWEDPPRVDRTDAAPVLAADGFAGPLDWWLDLACTQKIDFSKISIAALIGAFATALEAALATRTDIRLEHWGVWTVMAAMSDNTQRREFPGRAGAAAFNARFIAQMRLMIPVNAETRLGAMRHRSRRLFIASRRRNMFARASLSPNPHPNCLSFVLLRWA